MNGKQDSALKYILLALIPYTEQNLKLAYSPNRFFDDLEKISSNKQYSQSHLKNTFYNAKKAGLIDTTDKTPRLTSRGESVLKLYQPVKLENSQLMVIFDIPETEAVKRQAFRRALVKLQFRQVQRSVWITEYDHKDYLKTELIWLGIEQYVQVYEVVKT